MGAIANSKVTLAAAVANNGTVDVAYPAGFVQADLTGTTGGSAAINGDSFPQAASGANTVGFTFGASLITVTNRSGITWPAGSELLMSFSRNDINGSYNLTNPRKVQDEVG